MQDISSSVRPTLPTPVELREHSRRYQEAARKTDDAATRRQLAAHALTFAQIAEALLREGEAAQPETIEHYKRLLAGPLGGKVRQTVEKLLNKPEPERGAQSQVRAWRMRAEELRTTADGLTVPSAQEELRRAAANYDTLADQAEAQLRGMPAACEGQSRLGNDRAPR
jgi:hypothetical protein